MSTPSTDVFLAHYGKKGMKWGQRQNSSSGANGVPGGPAPVGRLSRREVRKLNKAGQAEFDRKKIEKIYEEASKGGDDVIIATRLPGDHAITLAGGKEIVNHLRAGGALDVKRLEVYARFDPVSGNYVGNNQLIGDYQKFKR